MPTTPFAPNAPAGPSSEAWELQCREFARLIAMAKSGSVTAFEDLYNRSARWLLSHVRCIVEDGQSEDVLAEVYLQVWNSLDSFDETRAPVAVWLVMIARSRAMDHLRRERRHGADPRHEPALQDDEHAEGPEQILMRLQRRNMVRLGLQALDEQERMVLGLAYFRDSSHKEICELTGLSMRAVKATMSRAQGKLRDRIVVENAPPAASVHHRSVALS